MEYIWRKLDSGRPDLALALSKSLNDMPLPLADMLVQRGVSDFEQARTFFRPSLDMLHDPFLMRDMDKAVARLREAVEQGQRVMVYGDYDVDGTTSVTVMFDFLRGFHPEVVYYIPDRYTEGYGVSYQGIDKAHELGCALIVSIDCGITATCQIQYARHRGIDFIVCDHHEAGHGVPPAVAVLDPKRPDCGYPYKGLSGCGVAFKLMQAYCQDQGWPLERILPYLDLLCVSIGADIVPMTGENRVLAHFGLRRLNEEPRLGLRKLMEVAGALKLPEGPDEDPPKANMTISDVVFQLGPRINAAGRLGSALVAVELLLCQEPERAEELAKFLDENNQTRRTIEKQIVEEAVELLEADADFPGRVSTVVAKLGWHKGVVGIVASKLVERYYRPTLVLAEKEDGTLVGSARSVEGFSVYDALADCAPLLDKFGGHQAAAGLSLRKANFEAFKQAFDEAVARRITPEQKIPKLQIDVELQLNDLTAKFMRLVKQFAPFGPENLPPYFATRGLLDAGSRLVGKTGEHVKFIFKQAMFELEGLGFLPEHQAEPAPAEVWRPLRVGDHVGACWLGAPWEAAEGAEMALEWLSVFFGAELSALPTAGQLAQGQVAPRWEAAGRQWQGQAWLWPLAENAAPVPNPLVMSAKKRYFEMDGIGFFMADRLPMLNAGKPISACFHLEENEFNGKVFLQMRIIDLKT